MREESPMKRQQTVLPTQMRTLHTTRIQNHLIKGGALVMENLDQRGVTRCIKTVKTRVGSATRTIVGAQNW